MTNLTEVTMSDQVWDTTVKVETDEADPDHSLSFDDTTAWAIVICIEVTLDHNTSIDTVITEAANDELTQPTEDTATDLTVTHLTDHIADHSNIEALQVINPEIIVGHIHDHSKGLQGMNHINQVHNPAG